MKKYVYLAGSIALALAMAGCSSSGSGGGGGGGGGSYGSAAALTNAYAASATHHSTSVPDSITALERSGGTSGFGAGTVVGAAAATGTTFKIGQIALDRSENQLILTIDGQRRVLNRTDGEEYHGAFVEAFGYDALREGRSGEVAEVAHLYYLDGTDGTPSSYVTIVGHMKSANWTNFGGTDYWYWQPNEGSIQEINALITGVLTPSSGIPKETVQYGGFWGLATESALVAVDGGYFDVKADFAAGKISGRAGSFDYETFGFDEVSTNLSGNITGSTFNGTATRLGNNDAGLNGQFAGGFFGPSAQQIAGTGNGQVRLEGIETDAVVIFYGQKDPQYLFAR